MSAFTVHPQGDSTSINGRETALSFDSLDLVPRYKYDDYHSIDWLRDLISDRQRHRVIIRMRNTWPGYFYYLFDSASGWLCVSLIAIISGFIVAFIDIGAAWMKDLRDGYCVGAFFLNREQCCWASNNTFFEGDTCEQWRRWPDVVGNPSTNSYMFAYLISYFFYVVTAIMFTCLSALFVQTFAPYACGSGIPEIKSILSGFIIRGYLGKWTLMIKSVGLILSTSAGLSLGKEGPLVHVASCVGNIISHWFPKFGNNEAKRREILSASAAAGVSAAFGAPIGGVLFSLEEVSYFFPLKTLWRSFFCALVTASVMRSLNPFGGEHLVLFYVHYTFPWSTFELIPFIFLGVMGGVVGCVFTKFNLMWSRYKRGSKIAKFPITEALVVSCITALLSYPNEFSRMNMAELIKLLFSVCDVSSGVPLCDYKKDNSENHTAILEAGDGVYRSLWLLTLALITKLIITIFTFGIKVPAGIFIPSLCLGAIMGRIVGTLVEQLVYHHSDLWILYQAAEARITPGLYAVAGAAACLGGVTRMTVSLVVIMFELTGSVNYIVPIMTSIMSAKWAADALIHEGVYDAHVNFNGYPYLDLKDDFLHTTIASNVMKPGQRDEQLEVIPEDEWSVAELESFLKSSHHNGYPVVKSSSDHTLLGFVTRKDLITVLSNQRRPRDISPNIVINFGSHGSQIHDGASRFSLRKLVDTTPLTVVKETPMEIVVDLFRKLGLRHLLVADQGVVLGIITRKDVLRHIKTMDGEETDAFNLR